MQNLSKASEQRMLEALEKAATRIAEGDHPNDALIKAAGDAKIPAGHVRLMVNAINTGRTNSHRETADDPLDKSAEFPLADAPTILSALYPDTVSTKSASHATTAVAAEYKQPPHFLETRRRKEMQKTAQAIDWRMTNKKLEIHTDPDRPAKLAWDKVHHLHVNVDETRRVMTETHNRAYKVAQDLRNYFKSAGHISFPEVADNARIMFGDQAARVLRTVAGPALSEKRACFLTPVDTTKAPYSLILEAIKLAAEYSARQEAYTAAVKTANDEAKALLDPFARGPAEGRSVMVNLSSWPGSTKQSVAEEPPKGKSLAGHILGWGASTSKNLVSSGLGLAPAGDIAKDVGKRFSGGESAPKSELLSDLMDPSHDMEIRNIQSEALLNDLMANDDVIRGHHPEEVVDAYNEVSQLAPYASTQKAIIRDLLRKRLSGGGAALDQFMIGDALNSQSKLKEQHVTPETSLSTMKDMGVLPGVTQTHSKSVLGK